MVLVRVVIGRVTIGVGAGVGVVSRTISLRSYLVIVSGLSSGILGELCAPALTLCFPS